MAKTRTTLLLALLVPSLLLVAAGGSAVHYRSGKEDVGKAAALAFLQALAPGKDPALAFELTTSAAENADLRAMARDQFLGKLARARVFDVNDPTCPTTKREDGVLNSFTMADVQLVQCTWAGGSTDIQVYQGKVSVVGHEGV